MPLRDLLTPLRRRKSAAAAERDKPSLRTSGYQPVHTHFWQCHRDLPLFSFTTIHQMMLDGEVKLSLATRAAPIQGAEFAFKDGKDWVPGIKARKPEVGQFVLRQLQKFWQNHLHEVLTAQIWGWAAGEITLRLNEEKLVELAGFEPRHAADVRVLKRGGYASGVRFSRVQGSQHVDLSFPRAFFHAHDKGAGEDYGRSVLLGAYSPWADKVLAGGACDVRRLFMHKDAYGGIDLGYPSDGDIYVAGQSEPIPARDVARQIAEQVVSGGVVTRPSDRDDQGNEKWPLERATVPNNPTHILDYPKDLDREIRRGVGIPDQVIDNDGSGAWAGARVPLATFYAGLDTWGESIVTDLCEQVIDPLILLNWGEPQVYEATLMPLAEQAMKQQANAGPGEPAGAQQPSQPAPVARMSLDTIEAVGRGVLDASTLVEAANEVIRQSETDSEVEDGS